MTGAVNPDVTGDESLDGISSEKMKDWIEGEEHDDAYRDEQKGADVGHSSPVKSMRFMRSLVFCVGNVMIGEGIISVGN